MIDRGADGPSAPTLRDYAYAIWRRRLVVVLIAVCVPVVALAYSLQQSPRYQANSEVLLAQQNLAPALTGASVPLPQEDADRFAVTQAQLARTDPVAGLTVKAAGTTETPGEFLASSSVVAAPDSDFLHFAVTSGSPAGAVRLATAYARQFTQYRSQLDTSALTRARTDVARKLTQLAKAGATKSRLYTSLQVQQQQLSTLEIVQTPRAIVANLPTSATQIAPRPLKLAVIAGAIGLLIGLMIAFLFEALDTRIRSADALVEEIGLPVLGRIAPPPRAVRGNAQPLVSEPYGHYAEAFRMLRLNIDFVNLEHEASVLMVTSALPGEGKSTVAANLAIAYARAGNKVLLVDLDLRRPQLGVLLDKASATGLTNVVLGRSSLEKAVVRVQIGSPALPLKSVGGTAEPSGSLHLLTTGPLPPDPGAFVETVALGRVLAEVKEHYDLVILDTPPVLDVGDALALGSRVDAVLVVARVNMAQSDDVRQLRTTLVSIPAPKLGLILTGVPTLAGYRIYGEPIEPAGTFLDKKSVPPAPRPQTRERREQIRP